MKPTDISSASVSGEIQSVTDLFHRLNSVLPVDQKVVSVPPDTLAVDALKTMDAHGYSQLPIMVGKEVFGLFSYRSFARAVMKQCQGGSGNEGIAPNELTVEDCRESATFARVTDEFNQWFGVIDKNDAILVGDPNRLQGIVTAMDILSYLYGVASPMVLVAEVELALRGLMRLAVDPATLAVCAQECLTKYSTSKRPTRLEDMTFGDYIQIIGAETRWNHFQHVFGSTRTRTAAKLNQLRDLRNTVFHFRRKLSVEEYENLAGGRDWLLMKARVAEARFEEAKQ
jgi:predicted transcriptional regulator